MHPPMPMPQRREEAGVSESSPPHVHQISNPAQIRSLSSNQDIDNVKIWTEISTQ